MAESSDNYLDINIVNIITITIMAAVGMLVITALSSIVRGALPGAKA